MLLIMNDCFYDSWIPLPLYLINDKNLDSELQNQKYFLNASTIGLSNCLQVKGVMMKKTHSNNFCQHL